MLKISGFMIVKDVIKQGYPFVEAIASALPVCDEFLVSDGYSTDGTFEVLQRIASLNKKVKVFQQRWNRRELTVLADLSNELRKKCKSDYLFYIQAAEVVHEENVKMLKAVPEIFPETDTFCLPFTFMVSNLKVNEEFRLRFCRNLSRINLTGDAWAFSLSKEFIRSEAIRNLKRPKRLLSYVGRGIDWTFAGSLNLFRSRALYLPKPIFRYQALFKGDFIERCKGHAWHFNLPYFYDIIKDVEKEEGEAFFEKVAQLYRSGFKINYQGALGVTEIEDHPKIIQEFIANRTAIPRYYVRDALLDAIANL